MPSRMDHRRSHNLLLVSKLLNQRENASPFTLIIDSLEQSAKPLLHEYVRRARLFNVKVIYVSGEVLRKPSNVDISIPTWDETLPQLAKALSTHLSPSSRALIIFDNLNALSANPDCQLAAFLSQFISPVTSVFGIYHADIPQTAASSAYAANPLTLLKYLSTTIITTHSFSQVLSRRAARDRSLAAPVFGLDEDAEGVLIGIGANDPRGLVLELEYRRKSGRGVREWYFLPSAKTIAQAPKGREVIILLEDHPIFRRSEEVSGKEEGVDTTFELGLTEKQRRDREGVVLPYFDAQKGGGPGEGGRILYDMGEEDDFDEEEDEI